MHYQKIIILITIILLLIFPYTLKDQTLIKNKKLEEEYKKSVMEILPKETNFFKLFLRERFFRFTYFFKIKHHVDGNLCGDIYVYDDSYRDGGIIFIDIKYNVTLYSSSINFTGNSTYWNIPKHLIKYKMDQFYICNKNKDKKFVFKYSS